MVEDEHDLDPDVRPTETTAFLFFEAYDGDTTNLPLEEALKDDVLLGHTVDGKPWRWSTGGRCGSSPRSSTRGRAPDTLLIEWP